MCESKFYKPKRISTCIECTSIINAERYNSSVKGKLDLKINKETDLKFYNFRKKILEKRWKLQGIDIDYEIFIDMLEQQNYKCLICNTNQGDEGLNRTRGLVVDHNHNTGEIRGLLCHRCNLAIGLLNDDEETMNNAIIYIGKSR